MNDDKQVRHRAVDATGLVHEGVSSMFAGGEISIKCSCGAWFTDSSENRAFDRHLEEVERYA